MNRMVRFVLLSGFVFLSFGSIGCTMTQVGDAVGGTWDGTRKLFGSTDLKFVEQERAEAFGKIETKRRLTDYQFKKSEDEEERIKLLYELANTQHFVLVEWLDYAYKAHHRITTVLDAPDPEGERMEEHKAALDELAKLEKMMAPVLHRLARLNSDAPKLKEAVEENGLHWEGFDYPEGLDNLPGAIVGLTDPSTAEGFAQFDFDRLDRKADKKARGKSLELAKEMQLAGVERERGRRRGSNSSSSEDDGGGLFDMLDTGTNAMNKGSRAVRSWEMFGRILERL